MAARGPDPHNLRNLARQAAPVIQTDRECMGCGYNLRGLRMGINCPECGMPSVRFDSDDPLSVMPLRVIFMLVRGCWTGSVLIILMLATVVIDSVGVFEHVIAMGILAALSVFWLVATIWLTPAFGFPQAISRGFGPRSKLRKAARWLQLGWIAATTCGFLDAAINPNSPDSLLLMGRLLGLFVGLAGLVVLSVLLEHLSEWARDEDAQKMFNWAMWSWPLAILIYAPVQAMISSWPLGAGRYPLFMTMFILVWVFAIGTFPYGLLMLAKSVTLSILHNLEYQDREQRRAQAERDRQERAASLARNTESQPMKAKSAR